MLPLAFALGCSSQPAKRFEDLTIPTWIKTKLPERSVKILENAEVLEVISIDPNAPYEEHRDNVCGYRPLGKTRVSDIATRRRIADALYKSVNEGAGSAFCFDPRHVVRASAAGTSVDFVICFECVTMEVHPGGQFPISVAAENVLNEILIGAGIPRAK